MIIFYVSFIIFDGMLLSSSQLNRTTVTIESLQIPDFWNTSIEIPEHPHNATDVNNWTQPFKRHKRSLHHHGRIERSHSEDVGRSRNIVDADEVDSRRSEVKRSQIVEEADSRQEKRLKIVDLDDPGNSEEKRVVDSDDDSEEKSSKEEHRRLKSSRKRGVARPKRKHHTKRVAKKDALTTDAPPGREKRSFVRDRYVGDTLFALELFLLFIPLACVGVVVLSLLQVCWSRTCNSDAHTEWTSEVKVSPPVDVTPKKKMTDIVSEIVANDVMAGGDAVGRKLCPARKKSLHKRIPPVEAVMSSPSDPPKSSSSLFVVQPLRGAHFPSTATFNSHIGGGRKGLRLKALINHQREPQRNEEAKSGLRGRPEEESPLRPSVEVNKRRHKTKSNPIEESSLSSSFQYPNYYPHDNKFYHREQ